MKTKLIKFGFNFLWFVKFWYGLSMVLTRHKKTPVKEFLSYREILEELDFGNKWRQDPLGGKLDVLTHPTRIQKRLNEGLDKIEDCDGHAAYWSVALLKSRLASKCWFSFFQMKNRDTGKITGHVVCVFEDFLGKTKWCDYAMPSAIQNKWDWAVQSANHYNGDVVAAAMIEVKTITKNDSIRFGKISKNTKF